MWKCFQNGEEKWEAFCKMWWAVTEWRKPDDVDIVGKHWMCAVSEQNRRWWITASNFWKARLCGNIALPHLVLKWVQMSERQKNQRKPRKSFLCWSLRDIYTFLLLVPSVDPDGWSTCCFLLQILSLKINESKLPLNITVKTILTETRDQVQWLKDRLLISLKPDERPIASDSPDKLVADWPVSEGQKQTSVLCTASVHVTAYIYLEFVGKPTLQYY